MKKITIAILMLLGTFSTASAELGVNVGISGATGVFTANGSERMGTTDRESFERVVGAMGYGSVFIEKTLGQYITVGIDYLPDSMESETADQVKDCEAARCTQTIKVAFEDMTTYYAAINVTENFYVKAGMVEVGVISKEALDTGGTYGNTSLDGTVLGAGYNKNLTNGIFLRAEGSYTDFDDINLVAATGEARSVKIKDIAGLAAKVSIGKSF